MQLCCAGPTSEKFIVQLSAAVMHQGRAMHRTCLRCEVDVFRRGCVTFAEYFTGKGASPTNHCCCQKTGVIAISCGIKISAVHHLVLSQYTHMTDGQNCDSNTVCRITGSCTVIIVLSYTTTCCTGSNMHI